MVTSKHDYRSIPGTYVQDAVHTRRGYRYNQCFMSLKQAESRERFSRDERAYLDTWDLTPAQRDAVLSRDWLAMLKLGGNVFFILKLAMHDGVSIQHVCGQMSGVSEQTFRQMMIDGGRRPTVAAGDRH